MSNALLEAMSYGLPCIGTNISGTNQLIENKKTGILIDNENCEQLADAIIFMFENREAAIEMGRGARRFIEDNFDIQKNILKYIQLYHYL
jgi:glycosyltransferase involved in cell wall biosynthesis